MSKRATIRFHKKYISVLCPNGHFVTCIELNKYWAGSMAEAEIGEHQAGGESVYDRLAAKCAEQDALEANATRF